MNSIEITISIPQGRGQRRKTKATVERIAQILEEELNIIDGNAWLGERETIADKLGISDTVPTLTAGKHVVEITL